jgi:DNA (cytosine-5)-methyltransferase 1
VQRAEARFDGLAGCLRTPRGGSSRQTLLVVENGCARTRLLSPREGARLMGLPDSYVLPSAATSALHVVGDGVAVPVVRWLAGEILEPLLAPAPAAIAAE